MTAWRKQEQNARLDIGNVFTVHGSVEPPKRHRLAKLTSRRNHVRARDGPRLAYDIAPRHVDASRGAPLSICSFRSLC